MRRSAALPRTPSSGSARRRSLAPQKPRPLLDLSGFQRLPLAWVSARLRMRSGTLRDLCAPPPFVVSLRPLSMVAARAPFIVFPDSRASIRRGTEDTCETEVTFRATGGGPCDLRLPLSNSRPLPRSASASLCSQRLMWRPPPVPASSSTAHCGRRLEVTGGATGATAGALSGAWCPKELSVRGQSYISKGK